MKLIQIVFMSFLLIGLSSCREKSNLEKEVMEIHDEVMPKIGKLNKQRKQLKKALPSVSDASIKNEIQQVIEALEKADDGMMDWMAAWDVPDDKTAQAEYLTAEMVKIKKVKEDMLSSMDQAAVLLKKIEQQTSK